MPLCARDDGLSEVVGFVLILALIVVALSLYQIYGVPAAGRENEIAHMNQVKDRFIDYKIVLDSLWLNNRNGVLLSTAFDLGTGAGATGGSAFALPILTPAGSGGTVSAKSGGANLTIAPEGKDPVTIPLGSLSYTSSNRYWVDQTWTYQMGAVFLSQDGGTTVRVGPSIAAAKTADENITLTVAPISLEGSAGIAGSGPVRVETRMRWSDPSSLSGTYDRVNLTVDAGDPATARAWKRAFDEVRQRAIEESVEPSWLSTGQSGNTATLTVQPEKKVFLTVYPANYTVSIYNAASLME
ncbi:DUF7289 family protein [Methanoculleus chikugoensis]|uniref:Uncharacterized protein n=1 Tax=Methanoculleus chikugoensis TaxID=118126 RepID=A0ABM7H860_9EURY|nr:hypothetical protein [Methanoculleus chikugoensis]BBL68871.1 hypothetical protein MchiMG62_20520 [Methanoculleus chikugoensis]